jgi:hypothetical protein
MTAAELRDILLSPGYRHDLAGISSYLASTAQERPMVHCLAKHLWMRGRTAIQLEADRTDLLVDDQRIEFKFNYDCNIEILEGELARVGARPIQEVCDEAHLRKDSKGWGVMQKIYDDICRKEANVFVWILCSRDLTGLPDDDRHRVRWWAQQEKYNAKYPYGHRRFLAVADSFLDTLRATRPFVVLSGEAETVGAFRSTYHFRICDFPPSAREPRNP